MDDKKLYVHYGCGQCAPPEWKNFDVSPTLRIQKTPVLGFLLKNVLGQKFDKNVKYGDVTEGLPGIADNSVDGAYCSHVLEHMSLEDFRLAIANTYKMLKPGGVFRLIMPDLKVLVDDYIADKAKGDKDASIRFIKRTIMGMDKRPSTVLGRAKQAYGYLGHLWLWDDEATINELEKAGFKNIRKIEFNDSPDPMFKLVENEKRFELCVKLEAVK
ncbi:class I SAM-dependent methyltransferase [Mucilaginibacter myungsuensis]|uniref:Class I SAM-dependent methyltransferase n=1 Tax=Mucilaginibacter myungsuensis TaxID=649104 RepID=A0A929KZ00_9SPHI|nr:methyltransferase domain-containing protein [Mucilaginibacter myungsuensis]MBE9661469.1 class I SAM-dependent methyltransferase [Mucilaginibacter myungsuensis]MDN3597612.1 methyltransferase domain-containing protein [Mucilaginibacter myungsuensis]